MSSRPDKQQVFLGESPVRVPDPAGGAASVERDGERFYRIAGYHTMPPFFMSVVSGHDHWLFVSKSSRWNSTGAPEPPTSGSSTPIWSGKRLGGAWLASSTTLKRASSPQGKSSPTRNR